MRIVRQVVSGSNTENVVLDWQCLPWQQPPDMPGMGVGEQAAHRSAAQFRKGQGVHPSLALSDYSPWPGGRGGSLQSTSCKWLPQTLDGTA